MIDPKRLTEKDKGREVVYSDGGLVTIYDWHEDIIWVWCEHCETLNYSIPEEVSFAHGTYQDGGAE